jgi:hypothetical protein
MLLALYMSLPMTRTEGSDAAAAVGPVTSCRFAKPNMAIASGDNA